MPGRGWVIGIKTPAPIESLFFRPWFWEGDRSGQNGVGISCCDRPSELEIRLAATAASSLTDPDVTTKRAEFYTFNRFGLPLLASLTGGGDVQPDVSSNHNFSQVPKHRSGTGVDDGQHQGTENQ